ncbi:MAG: PQQ-binding-like beta-propeller repeat protein, partial [Pirellula sp.]|nr:PQQ-binding-like beta-propeller repeat protein [Pirellula sp.]
MVHPLPPFDEEQPMLELKTKRKLRTLARWAFLAAMGIPSFGGLATQLDAVEGEWANWRGPLFNGASMDATPPTSWSQEKNIAWKAPIDGMGSSTPIVWGNQIFVLSAIKTDRSEKDAPASPPVELDRDIQSLERDEKPRALKQENTQSSNNNSSSEGQRPASLATQASPPSPRPPQPRKASSNRFEQGPVESRSLQGRVFDPPGGGRLSKPRPSNVYQFVVASFDLESGKKLWQTVVTEEVPHEGGHGTNNFASASPVTDGKHLYVFFGSRGIFCLDLAGKVIWTADLGEQITRNEFGEGASAALYKDFLIVPWDHEADSFIAALDPKSGDLKWKTARAERTNWCTPLIVEHKGIDQVIMNGRTVRSYNLNDGSLLWECGGQTENPIPTPFVYEGNVIATTGFRGAACYAISLDAKGDVSQSKDLVKWNYNQNTPYVPSATLYKGQIYFLSENKNILTSLDASTGKPIFARTRINGLDTIYSSIGAAADKIYVTGRSGTTVVMKAGPEPEVLSTNELGEEIDASPVFVGNKLLLRSASHLYCIQE